MDQARTEGGIPVMEQTSMNPSECLFCRKILHCFEIPKQDECIEIIGTVSDLLPLENVCPNHSPMIEAAVKKHDQNLLDEGQEVKYKNRSIDDRKIQIINYRTQTALEFFILDGDYEIPLSLTKSLVYNKNHPNHSGDAIILNPKTIDIKLIERWKKECEENHEKCRIRRSLRNVEQVRPLLLIDTHNQCIVSAEDVQGDFVALSYCWGMPEPGKPYWFRNEKAILEDLKRPKSLAPGSKYGKILPGTIKDTIELVRQIGEVYLWIDSLCIVQDDDDMKSVELPKMSEIYASACLTVVAAEGSHADFGLPGFEFTRPRVLDQEVVKLVSETIVTPISYTHAQSSFYGDVAYYTRGWTFQEYRFGRRRLILEHESVRWECREAAWCEDLKDEEGLEYLGNQWETDELPDPGVKDLNGVINQYNVRELGRKEDAFPAFCGFQRVLSRLYPHGFINGMPLLFFDVAMAWLPFSRNLERRKAEVPNHDPPSWSWIGWKGEVDINFSDDQHPREDRSMYSLHVSNLVDWYTMISLNTPKKPLLESSQPSNEEFALSKEPSLLFCQTHAATFQFGEPLFETEMDKMLRGPYYNVHDMRSKWSGILRLHNEKDAENLVGQNIELVAISKGNAPEEEQGHPLYGLMEWHVKDRPKDGPEYHYYNVLWIERKDGIAYRKAGGRIAKTVWETSDLQPLELTLG